MSRTCASVAATGGALTRTIAGGSATPGGHPPHGRQAAARMPAAGATANTPATPSAARALTAVGPRAGPGRGGPGQRGKRDDDDDWRSTEWEKLSDEQYWAEVSADKPLSAMAKPSRPASDSGAKAPGNGSAKRAVMPPAAREPRPA